MGHTDKAVVIQNLRTLLETGAPGTATDAQLLRHVIDRPRAPSADASAAEAAFAALVARHGPMVLGVCRRGLRDPADVADAFQATFLVLVRRADAVRVEGAFGLSRWLFGVSRRVVRKVRMQAARRAKRTQTLDGIEPIAATETVEHRELLRVIDEEVARLREPYRSAVVLCDLSGLPREAAVRQLGCASGTLDSRLARGRSRLRTRLTRRGFELGSFGAFAPILPRELTTATLRAFVLSEACARSSLILTEGVLREMNWLKLKVAAVVVTLGLGSFGAWTLARPAADPAQPEAKVEPVEAPIVLQPMVKVRPGHSLLIEVLEALPGRPISGTRLVRPDGTIGLGFYGDLKVAGLTRDEIKVKVIEHLKRWISMEKLGLVVWDDGKKKPFRIAPIRSDRVFVDDAILFMRDPVEFAPRPLPIRLQPGDRIDLMVLMALPGRPISGERLVGADGVVNLGFYGDVPLAGLTRNEAKAHVIEHLRRILSDETLGLRKANDDGAIVEAAPAESTCVFIDESPTYVHKTIDLPKNSGPNHVKPGDYLLIEVLEALPGRPISGERLVKPDGTISLGFYGDVLVAGLTRANQGKGRYPPEEVSQRQNAWP